MPLGAATREHGYHTTKALAAYQAFYVAFHRAVHAARAQLPHLLIERPAEFWYLLSLPWAPVGAMAHNLASHFEALLYQRDIEALAALAVVPIARPLTSQELQSILDTHYQGAASTGLWPVPSHSLLHLPLPAPDVLAPFLAVPLAWAATVVVDNHNQPCVEAQEYPSDPAMYWGFSVLHPLGKLLALCYLYRLDEETHGYGWLAEKQVGFCLGHQIEDHQLLLTYFPLVASH